MACDHIAMTESDGATPRKLGRRAVKTDSRTLRLSSYIKPALPAPPASCDYSKGITYWGMMNNDTLGCCTVAAAAHAIQIFSANVGTEVTLSDAEVLAYYSKWDGYVPGDPSTDNGGIELDVLNRWKNEEFAGHPLLAFADASVKNMTELKQAIWLFGGLYIGFSVPAYIMQNTPERWDVASGVDDGIVGGHAVFVMGYDADGVFLVSWGGVYKMTWAFWARYVDEAHALLSREFLNANGLNPAGFNLDQLTADLAAIH